MWRMSQWRIAWRAAAALVAGLFAMLPAAAQAPELAMFDGLKKGGWLLRIRDDGSQRRICLRTGSEFIQLRHRQPGCSQFVVKDEPSEIVVQYTCRGNGYGRTSVRREDNELVQVKTQGIYNGVPFAFGGEARYEGPC